MTGEGNFRWWLTAMAYFTGPFPSNVPFIAAGAGDFSVRRLAIAFALVRAFSDTLLVWTAGRLGPDTVDLVKSSLTSWRMLIGQLGGLIGVVLVFRLPWSRWLPR